MSKQYFCLEPARFKLDGGAMFGIIPKPLWSKVHPADEQNRIDLALRLLLIKTENKIILIDTGIGDYHDEKFESRFGIVGKKSPLELALQEIGISPLDVTDLVISHLHFDHVGGIGKFVDGKITPVLPNATIHLHKDHYAYSKKPTQRDTGSFQSEYYEPIIDWYKENNKLHLIEGMEGSVMPELKFKCSMGHTPFLLHAYDDRFIYMADLIPTSNHVHIPWVLGYDISPGITTTDKMEILPFIEQNKLTMIFEHDPEFFGSLVVKDAKGNFICGEKMPHKNEAAYLI
jgi:glyoxylase-like metal-dependent hydrolase (beta-lactamase superfamily II)